MKPNALIISVLSAAFSLASAVAAPSPTPCPAKPCVLQAPICGDGPKLCRLLSSVFGDVGADKGWKRDPGAGPCGSTIGGLVPTGCGQEKIWDANCGN